VIFSIRLVNLQEVPKQKFITVPKKERVGKLSRDSNFAAVEKA